MPRVKHRQSNFQNQGLWAGSVLVILSITAGGCAPTTSSSSTNMTVSPASTIDNRLGENLRAALENQKIPSAEVAPDVDLRPSVKEHVGAIGNYLKRDQGASAGGGTTPSSGASTSSIGSGGR